jgi:GNAT superfamily N-acetyltransferase
LGLSALRALSTRDLLSRGQIAKPDGLSYELDTACVRKFPCKNDAMKDFRIRAATFDDVPHIVHHRRAMYRDMGSGTDTQLDAVAVTAEAFLRHAIPSGQYRGWLAVMMDGRVAAGAGINIVPWPGAPHDPTSRRGWIQNVYTEPEFRRRGLARRLVETVVAWCRAEGFYTVSLHASDDGRALYESMGFRDTNEMRLVL